MPYFILPAVLDNRKAVLLDLIPKDSPHSAGYINNDIYRSGQQEILVIEKSRMLQSLVLDHADFALKDLAADFIFTESGLSIIFGKKLAEALLIGDSIPLPKIVKIKELTNKHSSNDIRFRT